MFGDITGSSFQTLSTLDNDDDNERNAPTRKRRTKEENSNNNNSSNSVIVPSGKLEGVAREMESFLVYKVRFFSPVLFFYVVFSNFV
jgi:hypothetical protein